MAVNAPPSGGGGFGEFASEHPDMLLGGVVVAVLLVGSMFLKKSSTTSTTSTSDLSGLTTDANGNPIVYVPTSTSFTTNYTDSGNSSVNNTTTTTSNQSTSTTNNSATNVTNNPVAAPAHYALYWDQTYTFLKNETLGGLAYNVTKSAQIHGAPNGTVVTWQQIYTFNKKICDGLAAKYKYKTTNIANMPMKGGEKVTIPEWRKGS